MSFRKPSKILFLLLSCLSFALIPDCKKDRSILATYLWGNYFPLKPGARWLYQYFKSGCGGIIRDTLKVTVTRDTFTLNQWMQILEFKFSDHTEHRYLWGHGDTLRIIRSFRATYRNDKFVLPLQVGQTWPPDDIDVKLKS